MGTMALPALETGDGFTRYMNTIKTFPLLTPEEEATYGRKLREEGDEEAAYQLVTTFVSSPRSPCDIGATDCPSPTSSRRATSD